MALCALGTSPGVSQLSLLCVLWQMQHAACVTLTVCKCDILWRRRRSWRCVTVTPSPHSARPSAHDSRPNTPEPSFPLPVPVGVSMAVSGMDV